MNELELPDIKPRKARKNRFMTRENVRSFVALIANKKGFKKFEPFLEKIKLVLESDVSSEEKGHDLQDLSLQMKALNPKLYKKLTDKIFDSDKKSENHKSVKIDRRIMEALQQIYPAFEVKEDLVNRALTDLIRSVNSPKSTEQTSNVSSYTELEKKSKKRKKKSR